MKRIVPMYCLAAVFALLTGYAATATAGPPEYYLQIQQISDSLHRYTHTVRVTDGHFTIPNLPAGNYRVMIIVLGDPHTQYPSAKKGPLNFSFIIDGSSNTIVSAKPGRLSEVDGDISVLPAGSPPPQLGAGRSLGSGGDRTLAPAKILSIARPGTVQGIIAILIGL